jgi:hypothetical protein
MARQTSVQITEATDRQVKAIQDAGFGTFTDIVRIAIDRMHNTEVRTMISITVDTDSQFSGIDDDEIYDQDASLAAYCDQLEQRLRSEFPDSGITVQPGDISCTRVDTGDDRDRAYVDQIQEDVFKEFQWVRYTTRGLLDNLDIGLWYQRPDGTLISAAELDTHDGTTYVLKFHHGHMPPHETLEFDDPEDLVGRMLTIADSEDWQRSET